MNNQIVEGLISLGIFGWKSILKSDYQKLSKENTDSRFIYLSGKSEDGFAGNPEWFKQVDTNNLSENDINLLLKISQAQNIKTIKNVLLFYFGITVICLLIAIFTIIIP